MKHVLIAALSFVLLTCPAFADTLTLTSGNFSFGTLGLGSSAGLSFFLSGGGASVSGAWVDDSFGWAGYGVGSGCNFSGLSATSCSGFGDVAINGTNYPYVSIGIQFVSSIPFVPPPVGPFPFGISSFVTVPGFFDTFGFACVTPGNDCVRFQSSSPALATEEFTVVGSPGPGIITAESISGTIVPEPSSMLLLGTGLAAIAGTIRRKLAR